MKTIQVFEQALCCSTGVCGTEVDQTLVTFTADVKWARQHGVVVDRVNLAQQPIAFAENAIVKEFLERAGQEALPLSIVGGDIAMSGVYPSRADLARWSGIPLTSAPKPTSCCSGKNCC
ncbi:MAG: arsenite efflux transporter metallochaperone ArsD [Chlorobiaceae bacterium]|nr:arsenite efflux transporter metallochaperone ArsD [Chlorobiaceae bacterium]